MATLKSAITLFAPQRSFSNNYHFLLPKSPHSIKLHASTSIPSSSSIFSHNHKLRFSSSSSSSSSSKSRKTLCFALQEVTEVTEATEAKVEDETIQTLNKVKTVCVFNLPWSLSAPDIKNLFAQCGNVMDVQIMKGKDGKGYGYAFVTMDSAEGAQAALNQFDAHEISGRIIRVEFAKKKNFKKPRPPSPPPPSDASHVIYASNLAWKARSTHLKEVFTENFKEPVSARVVFQTPAGRSAGYGFVSYHTEEEAVAAVSALEGKELMGRPLRVKISEKKIKKAESEDGEEKIAETEGEEKIAEREEGEEQVDDSQLQES